MDFIGHMETTEVEKLGICKGGFEIAMTDDPMT